MLALTMGWIGTIGSISAYLLLSRGRWNATSLRYSALNGVAGLLAGGASAVYGAWPSVASNLVWSCIALQSGLTTLSARRSRLRLIEPLPDTDPEPEPERAAGPRHLLLAA